MLKQDRVHASSSRPLLQGSSRDRQSRQDDYRLYRPSPTEALDQHTHLPMSVHPIMAAMPARCGPPAAKQRRTPVRCDPPGTVPDLTHCPRWAGWRLRSQPVNTRSLLAGTETPVLWFLDELVAWMGKVLARSGNRDLVIVGRSLDSMLDVLSGALAGQDGRLARRSAVRPDLRRPRYPPAEHPWVRLFLPGSFAQRRSPAGSTATRCVMWRGWRTTRLGSFSAHPGGVGT
jgi:hypothetical protein